MTSRSSLLNILHVKKVPALQIFLFPFYSYHFDIGAGLEPERGQDIGALVEDWREPRNLREGF